MLNLITDAWIPVQRMDGSRDVIRPDQIAEPDVLFPDWPRADLNLACLELLVGLVYLADPPTSVEDWKTREPDAARLREALKGLTPAFNLLGDGPRFLQDFDEITGSGNPPDMLFIDSAGGSTAKKNADLMVKRGRYPGLPLPLAAMALFTLQAFAPSGGAGNRTSMRGGGPMVTLVQPAEPGLWNLIWANVPQGEALEADELEELPWMRPTETSEKGQVKAQPEGDFLPPEMFFGMPRRLKLTAVNSDNSALVTGVVQKTYGTNYGAWRHPLSPYNRRDAEIFAKRPRPGNFGYRNWRGIVFQGEGVDRAACLQRYLTHYPKHHFHLLVGGWAVDKATPQDFLWSQARVVPLNEAGEVLAGRLVEAAEQIGFALASNTRQGMGEGEIGTGAANRVREQFFQLTQAPFEAQLDRISAGQGAAVPTAWLALCRSEALRLFDTEVMQGLADLSETRRKGAVEARRNLLGALAGYGSLGKKIFTALELELPKRSKKEDAA
ncbi:MAG: type I-E CRISPR-associated protein Cse1/CasA [Epibacterium sp.]|nr:type I-E CRISPR-associated protein Cse1/CasA [Epibacterium sp.]NQX72450.1 type I-E CRISPR-associated protein Cse1/CasA [Epibacterium sp.]